MSQEQDDYFERFWAATPSGLAATRSLDLCGRPLSLEVAPSLQPLLAAFGDLVGPPAEHPWAALRAWDSHGTAALAPPPPAAWFQPALREMVEGWNPRAPEASVWASYHPVLRIACLWHRGRRQALFWCRDARLLPFYEQAAPWRSLLHWMAGELGAQLCHAAVVGHEGRGLLLAGRGGSGKSTTACAAWRAGWQLCGDDYVLVRTTPEPRAFRLYSTLKLVPGQAKLISSLPCRTDPDSGKQVAWVGEGLSRSLPLRRLLAPSLHDAEESRLEPCAPSRLLAALAPSTMLQLVGSGGESWKALGQLARCLPGAQLRLGRDRSGVLRCLESACSV